MPRTPGSAARRVLIAAVLVALGGIAAALVHDDGSARLVLTGGAGVARPGPAEEPDPALPGTDPTPTTTTVDHGAGPSATTPVPGDATRAAAGPATGGGGGGTGEGGDGAAPAAPRLVLATAGGPMPGDAVTVDGVTDRGPARRVAQGFLHGIYPSNPGNLRMEDVARLRPTSWRLSVQSHASDASADWRAIDRARSLGAELTYLIIDTWHSENQIQDPVRRGLCAYAGVEGMMNSEAPWTNWAHYRAWVRDYVRDLVRNDRLPDYWEPFNEATAGVFNACEPFTVQRQKEVWKVTYEEIRGILPEARIIGPSPARYLARPSTLRPDVMDLTTFLDFVVANGLELAALNWHEIGTNQDSAVTVAANVREARAMLDRRGLTDTLIMVNEYLGQPENDLPGWIVAHIGAFEHAGADRAIRTCWAGSGDDFCRLQTVDGLFDRNGAPRAPYWVHLFYGEMAGTRVESATRRPDVSAFAVRDDDGGVLRVLVGRHAGCADRFALGCPLLRVPAEDVPVTVRAPWVGDRYRVVATRIAPHQGAVGPGDLPVLLDTVVDVDGDGFLRLVLPHLADGDAVTVTVTPA